MNNDQDEESREFHKLCDETTRGYSELMDAVMSGTITPDALKAKKKELRTNDQEIKRRFDDLKKATRAAKQ